MRLTPKYKRENFTAARLREVAVYDPETGIFTRRAGGVGLRAGDVMGSTEKGYRIIVIDGIKFLAQRLAWLYIHGEWPAQALRFKDGDSNNCAMSNLGFAKFKHREREGRNEYNRAHRKANPAYYRDAGLKKSFGIDLAEYQRKFAAQGGVCACCKLPETDTYRGQVKWLAVDHDHETGAIRDLLCCGCNKMLGYAKDAPALLRAAAEYLERHAAETPDNVVRLSTKRNPA